jgi:hypothetical protein
MEHSYYLTFKAKRKGGELSFNVGTREKTTILLKLSGRSAKEIFNRIIESLGRAGCITSVQTGNPCVYSIRDDVGPVLGTYLILVRRARNIDYWTSFLDELLTGKYARLGETFSSLLESTIELSKGGIAKSGRKEYTLSPAIVSAFSSALKVLIKRLKKDEAAAASRS